VENQADNYDAITYYIGPFCAPSFLTPSYLVETSTKFAKWSEFCNQALGETAEDAEESLVASDIEALHTPNSLDSGDTHFMGSDMGVTCHVTIGRLSGGSLLVVHREKVQYTEYEARRRELCAKYRVVISVMDAFPYSDIAARITGFDPNAYAAIYVAKKSTENYIIKDVEEDPIEGKLNLRAVHINRDVALDSMMYEIKNRRMVVHGVDQEFVSHLLDMKRIQIFDKQNQMRYTWKKTKGEDHYAHALLYLSTAAQLQGTVSGYTSNSIVPFVSSFALRRQ
jgi:hypothetical protein